MKCCICGTVKNCEKYLDRVFYNIEQIGVIFDKYKIFIYYDESKDNTLQKLIDYKKTHNNFYYYYNKKYNSKYRTHRLAHGRNYCLNFIRNKCPTYEHFIMMDFDDVSCEQVHPEILSKYLNRDDWDMLSFNKPDYYDIWALSIKPYVFSYIHFNDPQNVLHNMKTYVMEHLNNLKEDELLKCISAFNGFAIYRTSKFINCRYDGKIRLDLIPNKMLEENIKQNNSKIVYNKCTWLDIRNEDCEHRSFHIHAIRKYNAKIRISPEKLFENL